VELASAGTNVAATVGTYPISITNAVGEGLTNYTLNYVEGLLTVDPALLTLSALDTNKAYGTELALSAYSVAGLTNADMNEEGANMLMLQTRQALGTTSLSLASQAAQSVLRLF
jgi:hypothetical protein